jgi:hypothetical protein
MTLSFHYYSMMSDKGSVASQQDKVSGVDNIERLSFELNPSIGPSQGQEDLELDLDAGESRSIEVVPINLEQADVSFAACKKNLEMALGTLGALFVMLKDHSTTPENRAKLQHQYDHVSLEKE